MINYLSEIIVLFLISAFGSTSSFIAHRDHPAPLWGSKMRQVARTPYSVLSSFLPSGSPWKPLGVVMGAQSRQPTYLGLHGCCNLPRKGTTGRTRQVGRRLLSVAISTSPAGNSAGLVQMATEIQHDASNFGCMLAATCSGRTRQVVTSAK